MIPPTAGRDYCRTASDGQRRSALPAPAGWSDCGPILLTVLVLCLRQDRPGADSGRSIAHCPPLWVYSRLACVAWGSQGMAEKRTDSDAPRGGVPEKSPPASRRNLPARASTSNSDEGTSGEAVAEIVAGCQRGDRGAQRRLYESFDRMVYRLMVRIVGVQEAADLTQQVFLHVFGTIGKYSGRGRFDRWLYRLAVNEAFQHLRRNRRRQHGSLVYEPADESVGGDERTARKDLVEHGLARLDPELRSIFLLREIEELSYREIAETLDIPEGTVGSRLNRARRELKEHLVNLGWEP